MRHSSLFTAKKASSSLCVINDMGPKVVWSHPIKPELDGKDLSGSKDPNGKKRFVEFVDVCRDSGEGIQDSTDGTVTEIGNITRVVKEVNEIVSTIATAVEEQSVTTNEIAGNVYHSENKITGRLYKKTISASPFLAKGL